MIWNMLPTNCIHLLYLTTFVQLSKQYAITTVTTKQLDHLVVIQNEQNFAVQLQYTFLQCLPKCIVQSLDIYFPRI